MEMDDESERVKLETENNGVTVKGQFIFSKAVCNFLREEERVGGIQGELRAEPEGPDENEEREDKNERKVRVTIGSSQTGRLGEEMNKRHGDKVKVVGRVRIEVGGPTNSLVTHGKTGEW
jgi:hypothetical protein